LTQWIWDGTLADGLQRHYPVNIGQPAGNPAMRRRAACLPSNNPANPAFSMPLKQIHGLNLISDGVVF
jgi:hypothetical protein